MNFSGQKFDPKNNSIGILRLILAMSVIFSHSYELGGYGHDFISVITKQQYNVGAIAVDCFFVCSGYLITASYLKSKSLISFLWHRFLRLMPGYWIAICFDSMIVPLLDGQVSNFKYFLQNILTPLTPIFFFFNSINEWIAPSVFNFNRLTLFLQGELNIFPLFIHNPYPNIINGSLWTLPYEVKCYLIITVLGFLGFLSRKVILVLLFICLMGSLFFFHRHEAIMQSNAYRFPFTFLAGSIFYFWNFYLTWQISFLFLLIGILSLFLGFYPLIAPVVSVYIFFWLATVLPFKSLFRKKDYSYGVYIYAWPVQQTLSAYHFNQYSHWIYLALSICCTFPLAVLSWHLIEKPSLKLKNLFG